MGSSVGEWIGGKTRGVTKKGQKTRKGMNATHITGMIRGVIHCHNAEVLEVWEAARQSVEDGWG
jgi:hypothetical protein